MIEFAKLITLFLQTMQNNHNSKTFTIYTNVYIYIHKDWSW